MSLFAQAPTVLPDWLRPCWRKGYQLARSALCQNLDERNPMGNAITVYLHTAGVEGGYGFFAPNVPDSFTLVFEIHLPDGKVEYDLPRVRSAADGLRFNGLLDEISLATYEPLRQRIFKILTYSIWQSYPDASRIRAIFTATVLPSITEFQAGRESSHQVLYAYDMSFADEPREPQH